MALAGDNRCPLCRAALWAPDTEAIGSKSCPRCGAELWVLVGSDGAVFFIRQSGQSKSSFLATLAGMSAEEMAKMLKGADSLDLVEIVLEIEAKLRSNRGQSKVSGTTKWRHCTPRRRH
jgi:hypothetical protein